MLSSWAPWRRLTLKPPDSRTQCALRRRQSVWRRRQDKKSSSKLTRSCWHAIKPAKPIARASKSSDLSRPAVLIFQLAELSLEKAGLAHRRGFGLRHSCSVLAIQKLRFHRL